MTTESYEIIRQAAATLAAYCDGARAVDGMGYSKVDAGFGREIAARPVEAWSPRFARAAWKVVRKYRRQLPGVDLAAVEPPEVPKEERPAPKPAPAPCAYGRSKEVKIEAHGAGCRISFGYDPGLVAAVKAIPGARFERIGKTWDVARLDLTNAEALLAFSERVGAQLPDSVFEALVAETERAAEALEASTATDAAVEVPGLRGELLPFQRAGVAYALRHSRVLIADEMGLGKTIQALAAIQARGAYPAAVVCPASLKPNWKREAEKWLPEGTRVAVLNGGKGSLPEADLYVLNYELLGKWAEALAGRGLRALVADEAHYLKTRTAARTKAFADLAKKAKPESVLLLTGTPVMNRPAELASPLAILGQLDALGGWWRFVRRYCDARETRFGLDVSGAANLDELNERLRAACMVRRRKAEVLRELPAKRRAEVPVTLPREARKAYEEAAANIVEWKAGQAKRLALAATGDDEAARKASIEAARKAESAEALVRIEALKQLAVAGKLPQVEEWIADFVESGEKLVVFAVHRSVVERLAARFNAPAITGDTPIEDRQKAVDRFQGDPDCRLIVGNVQAMGVGLTLTAASNVLFVELPWRPADLDQAEDRCHRIGQSASVTAWYLLAEQTIDDDLFGLIGRKRAVVDAATEGGERGVVAALLDRIAAPRLAA